MDPVKRMRALLYYANSAKVARGLTDRGYPVSPPTVSRWANGHGISPLKVRLVEELLAEKMEQQNEAAPDWERLVQTVDAIAIQVGVRQDSGA